jgi:hypothetical protein
METSIMMTKQLNNRGLALVVFGLVISLIAILAILVVKAVAATP